MSLSFRDRILQTLNQKVYSEQDTTSVLPSLAPATLGWQASVVNLGVLSWLCSQDPQEVLELGLGRATLPYSVVLDRGISRRTLVAGRQKAHPLLLVCT